MAICPSCQSRFPDDSPFCGHCGGPLAATDDDSIAAEEGGGSEPVADWAPPDEEALHQITMAVAKLLAEGEGKEEIVRKLVRLNGWPEASAIGFVGRVEQEMGGVIKKGSAHQNMPEVQQRTARPTSPTGSRSASTRSQTTSSARSARPGYKASIRDRAILSLFVALALIALLVYTAVDWGWWNTTECREQIRVDWPGEPSYSHERCITHRVWRPLSQEEQAWLSGFGPAP